MRGISPTASVVILTWLEATLPARPWCRAMDTEADKLHRDLQRCCHLLSRITDEEAIRFPMAMMGEAAPRLKEVQADEDLREG